MCEHVGITYTEVSFILRSNKCIEHGVSYREVSLLQNVDVSQPWKEGLSLA